MRYLGAVLSVHKFYIHPLCSPVLPDNIHKMSIALLSEVFGTQLDEGWVVHAGARCPRAAGHAQTGSGPGAGAGLLFLLLKHVAQGALAGSHRLLQRWTQETIGSSGAVTWDDLDAEETTKKKSTRFSILSQRGRGVCVCLCACVCCTLALLVLCSSWQPFSTATSSPCSVPEGTTTPRDTQGG